jgi:hypothetical protein
VIRTISNVDVLASLAQSIQTLIQSQSASSDERPAKRRKVVQDVSNSFIKVENDDHHDDYVVLCRVTVNLVSCSTYFGATALLGD